MWWLNITMRFRLTTFTMLEHRQMNIQSNSHTHIYASWYYSRLAIKFLYFCLLFRWYILFTFQIATDKHTYVAVNKRSLLFAPFSYQFYLYSSISFLILSISRSLYFHHFVVVAIQFRYSCKMYNISDENYTSSLLTLLSSRVFVCSFIVVAYFTSQEFLRDRSRYENTGKKRGNNHWIQWHTKYA